MLKSIMPRAKGILFETTLDPATATIDKLRMERVWRRSWNKGFSSRHKQSAIGYPYSENLIAKIQNENAEEEILHQIKAMMNNYDFHFVTLYCSFLPGQNNSCLR